MQSDQGARGADAASLLSAALDAHGGLERWNAARALRAHASIGGTMWGRKGHPSFLSDVWIDLDPHRQWVSYTPFGAPDHRSVFEPDHNAIERLDGTVVEQRRDPIAAFARHGPETLWDELNVAYFSGYAIWNYLTTPFLLTLPGVHVERTDPWRENGETWLRLEACFPDTIATHNRRQTFYFDSQDGLLRRHDYNADVFGGVATANYAQAPKTFDGLVFPTQRRVVPRTPDNTTASEPILVSIDLSAIYVES